MKTLWVRLSIIMVSVLLACGCGSSGPGTDTGGSSTTRELLESEPLSGTITTEGEVDWYHFNAVETNRTLTVNCASAYRNSPVDFMLTVFERDGQGNMELIFGKSAPEDAAEAANIVINIRIDQPKDLSKVCF